MTRAAGAALVLLTAAGAAGAQPVPPDTFRHERTVTVTAAGPQRLDLDALVLAGSQPVALYPVPQPDRRFVPNGPPDLRLYTMSGVEVPYLFVAPPLEHQKVVIGSVKAIAPTEKTSGFEVDYREIVPAMEVVALDQIPPPFLKRFRLEGSGDRTRWTVLVAEGTAFNLPAEGLRHVKIPFDPGDYRYLRVTWDDTNSARVSAPPSVGAYRHVDAYAGPALRVPLTFERRNTEPGRSRFHVTLPGSRLPIMALDLAIGGGHLMRDVRVLEAALARDARPTDPGVTPQVIGQARLTRVIKDGATAEAIRVEIPRPPSEPDLDLVFDDGNNPPIDLQGVTAVFADLPWIYFESEPGTLIARYGSPKTEAPRYDLEAIRGSIPVALGRASWGAERTPPAEAPRPAPGLPMPTRGAAMTIGDFAYRRALPSGPQGLSVIPLDAAALAHSASERGHFADIRVLDADGLQVPYLLEKRDEPLTLAVRLERREPSAAARAAAGSSEYVVSLPYRELRGASLVLTTRARVFRRTVRIGLLPPPDRQGRATALQAVEARVWEQSDDAVAAAPLRLPVPYAMGGDVVLEIDEGDNQPLPLEPATLLLPSYAVRFFRSDAAPLLLAYGRRDLTPPRYDLALLSPFVLGQRAQTINAGPENGSPATGGVAGQALVSPVFFWGALGLSVVVLLGVVVRLVRRDT